MEQVTPQSLEAEQAYLACLLSEKVALEWDEEHLSNKDFYRENHRIIHTAIEELRETKEPIDIVTIGELLRKRGALERIGGESYLRLLTDSVPTTSNWEAYGKTIQEKSIQRQYLEAIQDSARQIYNSEFSTLEELKDKVEHRITQISVKNSEALVEPIKSSATNLLKVIEEQYKKPESEKRKILTGTSTGFPELDRITDGAQKGELLTIGARPGMGKSALGFQIAYNIASKAEKYPTLAFSLEMNEESLLFRLLSMKSSVVARNIRKGLFSEKELKAIRKYAKELADVPLYIEDKRGITVLDIRSKARALYRRYGGLEAIIVDYAQLISSTNPNSDNATYHMSMVVKAMADLAGELNTPLILLSQLNRALGGREDKRPTLMDLKQTGAFEEHSHTIIFIHREQYYESSKDSAGYDDEGSYSKDEKLPEAEIILAKQRAGETGTVRLQWDGKYTRFNSIERTTLVPVESYFPIEEDFDPFE